MPSLSSVRTRSTCCLLVSGFFTEIAQQIHSLRASGVRSSHAASASASDARVLRQSSGKSWTTPPEIAVLVIDQMALPRKDCRSYQRLQFAYLLACLLPCRIVARRDRAAGRRRLADGRPQCRPGGAALSMAGVREPHHAALPPPSPAA